MVKAVQVYTADIIITPAGRDLNIAVYKENTTSVSLKEYQLIELLLCQRVASNMKKLAKFE